MTERHFDTAPPLSLYVHLPWCVEKCPYCDFNSHPLRGALPETDYVEALLRDLDWELTQLDGARPLRSIFFGGGTPSLFSAAAIGRVLRAAEAALGFAEDIEITLEANPGAIEAGRFAGFREAGVNRLSIGVQSFDDAALKALGRIHDARAARAAIAAVQAAGFTRFNVDLMYGLPGQSAASAGADVQAAIGLGAPHISYYELTIEPNTAFARTPPQRPAERQAEAIEAAGHAGLRAAGYQRYEISAWACEASQRSRHNLNYWRFGDYLGIGAGAHGKWTDFKAGQVLRRSRVRHPRRYLAAAGAADVLTDSQSLSDDDLLFESLLNGLRLCQGVNRRHWEQHTGLPAGLLDGRLAPLQANGDLRLTDNRWQPTPQGVRYLDSLLTRLLPDGD